MPNEETDQKVLELAIAGINKQYGENSVIKLGSADLKPWPAISTGALTLDLALGIGGLPKGRIVEIYGPESSGKTTLALMVVAAAQAAGGICGYIDAEHALDPIYAKAIGVEVPELYLSQPECGEDALDICNALIRTGQFSVVVIDSVAALTPRAELEGEMSDQNMGLQARMMSKIMRKINGTTADTETLVIFINQIREKIGVMFGSPETQPGGRALKFFASVRIDIRKIEMIKDKNDGSMSGVKTKAKIVKNKMAPPYREAEFDIIYGRGINSLGCIFDAAVTAGFIEKKGAWFNRDGVAFAQGRDNGIKELASNLALADELEKLILEKANLGNVRS
jgi:recombination protein RecA